jgi:hypothetical protein
MRSVHACVATIAAALLSGCQTLNDVVGSSPSREPAPAESVMPAAPPAVAPSGGAISTSGLAGMSADGLRSAWGEPTLKRTETGAELWQYSGTGGCTLLVYVYSGAVTHAEAVPGGASDAAVSACAKAAGKPSLRPVS